MGLLLVCKNIKPVADELTKKWWKKVKVFERTTVPRHGASLYIADERKLKQCNVESPTKE